MKTYVKTAFASAFLLALFLLPHPARADIASGLVGWWKLDEGAGTTAMDSSGNGHDAVESGSPSHVAGHIGPHALSFDAASNQYVSSSTLIDLSSTATATIAFWANIPGTPVGSTPDIFSFWLGDSSSGMRFVFELNDTADDEGCGSAGGIYLAMFTHTSGGSTECFTSMPSFGDWHHFVAQYDSNAKTLVLYIDDSVQLGSNYTSSGFVSQNLGVNEVDIGDCFDSGIHTNFFTGSLDDVRLYDRALSAGDVAQLFAYTSPSVLTSAPSSVSSTTLTLNGSITATGEADAIQSGFAYGTTSDLSVVIATSTLGPRTGTTSFSQPLTGLTASTTYYFRAYAVNSAGTSTGSIESTTTLAASVPSPQVPLTFTRADYTTGTSPSAVATGDFDGDGKIDIVTTNPPDSSISILFGTGLGTFASKIDYSVDNSPYAVAVEDLNGDGKPDLAVVYNSYLNAHVSVLINNGDGTFAPEVDYPTISIGTCVQNIAIGDLNGDGKPDLAVTNGYCEGGDVVSVLINHGDGTFASTVNYPTGKGVWGVTIGDLNGDGKPDIVTSDDAGAASVFLNEGDGTFSSKVDLVTGPGSQSAVISDLNGDGKPDLAVGNYVGNSVSVFMGNGDGTFVAKVDYVANAPNNIVVGDLNGDGKPDLEFANGLGFASIIFNEGDGTFAYPVDYPVGSYPYGIAIAYLNSDNKPDLVLSNNGSNFVSVLLNSTSISLPGLSTSTPSVSITSVTLNASITDDGGASSTIRGFYWGINSTYGATTTQTGISGTGSFSTNLTNLTCNTTYHYAAYAVNLAGTTTTEDSHFTTSPCQTIPATPPTPAPVSSGGSSGGSVSLQDLAKILAPGPATDAYLRSRGLFQPNTVQGCPTGLTCTPNVAPVASSAFTRNLQLGSIGPDVQALQQYLNNHGFTIASTGPGSPGNETTKFGSLTKLALIKFQKAHGITPAVGYFGPVTRTFVTSTL